MLVPIRRLHRYLNLVVTMWTFLFSLKTSTTCGSFFFSKTNGINGEDKMKKNDWLYRIIISISWGGILLW